tara:strand:+ start:78541 stop:79044 length:504 start_codon:yes stop_codon:yes gene_type:complete
MKILLCGFMGSGKTTLFERIKSKSPEVSCKDLDQLIEEKLAEPDETLGDVIGRVGWEKFREVEESLLYQELSFDGNLLISLGGGSLTPRLVDEIDTNPEVRLIWLDTDFETCWSRVSDDAGRPLVAKGKDFLKNLYNERKPLYERASIHLNPHQQGLISNFQQLIEN